MAWVPTSRFEHELRKKEEFSGTVPIHTYEHLEAREDLLGYGTPGGKGREIRQSLQMMETIQRVAGTKPLGEHATMEDWEDTATAEREAIAITRSFGRLSVRQDSPPLQPQIAYVRLLKMKASDFL